MKKQALLAVILASVPLMSAPEARQISVDRLYNLATVLGENFESNPKKVGDVNALPIDVLDIDVNRKQIDLAWALHTKIGGDPDKLAGAQKAIEIYADEVMEEAADVLAKQEEKEQAGQVAADKKGKTDKQTALDKENKAAESTATQTASGTQAGGGAKPQAKAGDTSNRDDELDAKTYTHEVAAKGIERRCRAGKCFTKTPTPINQDDFEEEQFAELESDEFLKITVLDKSI